MIVEMEFYSGGHLRWNIGWPTPNYAGAFLVTLLALGFVTSCSRRRWLFFAVEAGGLLLLAKTYSRGAVLAWGAAWLFGVVSMRAWREPGQRLLWVARVGVFAIMLFSVGFGWSRATDTGSGIAKDPTVDTAVSGRSAKVIRGEESPVDGSVVNRLALWRGGLQMIAAAPVFGWGAGESGRNYMNWYQQVDRTEGYTTMVNSYLHVAVEHGLLALGGVLFGLAWNLLVAWCDVRGLELSALAHRRLRAILMMAMGSSLVAWAVANVFTTLWIEPRLWVVPIVAVFVLVWGSCQNTGARLVSITAASLALACIAVGSLYVAGQWLLSQQPVCSVPLVNGSVGISSKDPIGDVWHIWPDSMILGQDPGKELRRWLQTTSAKPRLVVHRAVPSLREEVSSNAEGVMLFGRQVERLSHGGLPDYRNLWIIHPVVPPSALPQTVIPPRTKITLVLPKIDEIGNGPAWRRWALECGARVIESPGCGLDIRAAWPALINNEKDVVLAIQVQ